MFFTMLADPPHLGARARREVSENDRSRSKLRVYTEAEQVGHHNGWEGDTMGGF